MTDDLRVRPVADGDWDDIVVLEADAYTELGLSEGRAALESRARVSPSTCFVLDDGARVAGYVLALPYPMYRYPDLAHAEDGAFDSTNLHLHDLVIAGDLRRRGLATRLLGHLTDTARAWAYDRISLVAVGGSEVFWSASGFRAHREVMPPSGYGADAVYMSRPV